MNDLKLIIGNKNYSTWSLRPWFFLKNLDIEFEEELIFLFQDDTNEYLKPYNSNDKVPILINKGFQVWDTLAIIETIADQYPEKQGWPKDSKARAVARAVSAEMHSSFLALRNALPMNLRKHFANYPITDDVQLDIDRIVQLWDYCRKYSNNSNSKGSWLLGDFSGADAMFAPVVMRLLGYDVNLTGFAAEYLDFVYSNKHMQEWIESSKKETQIILEDEV